jgi:hypothetical protein
MCVKANPYSKWITSRLRDSCVNGRRMQKRVALRIAVALLTPGCHQGCDNLLIKLEAPPGFEPGVEVLQTSALPLGDGAP